MRRLRLIALFLCGITAAARSFGAEDRPFFIIKSPDQVEMDFDTGLVTLTNGVVVKYGDTVLTARRATLNEQTGEIQAEGDVRLERAGDVLTVETLQYNFITRKIIGTRFRSGQPPYFVQGATLVGDRRFGVYAGADGMVTTDDVAEPGHRVRAKSIVIVPGEYILARHATVYLGKVPVFYFPYYRHNLKQSANRFTVTPGYRSKYGPYLRTAYNWYWNERLDGALHLDGWVKRGVGAGAEFNWHLPRGNEGSLQYNYIYDTDPGEDPFGGSIPTHRQRLYLDHQGNLASNLTAKAALRYQTDAYVTRDFFESEYRDNVQPISFLELNRAWSNWSLDLLAQPQVNSFFQTVERLPDLKLSGLRQQIARSPLYYESESSLGWFRQQFADDFTNNYSAWRADTFHQVLLPHTFFNWLNVAPRVGGRFTHYGRADVFGTPLEEQDRFVFNTGAEVSFKLSRLWRDVQSRTFSLNGLRHIAEPSVNYVYVPEPNRTPGELPQFDYHVPTTRLLPIDFPDYNTIDSIDSQNVLRLSLRNRLQTKRKDGVEDVLNWALYTDWRLRPRDGQGTFSDVYSELELKPFPWLTFFSDLRYDLDDNRWDEANHAATFAPNTYWSLTVGHRYLRDDYNPWYGPGFDLFLGPGYNLLYDRLYFRLNENWGFSMSHYFEADDHILQEQQYTLYRDFRSWTGALTFRVRENVGGETDYAVAFTFSMKAFPRFRPGQDSNRPSTLLGY